MRKPLPAALWLSKELNKLQASCAGRTPDAHCCLFCAPAPPAGIRDHFVQSVELKFNCFFLMPIIDTFPTRLREELESAYEEDLDEVGVGAPWEGCRLLRMMCGICCLE